MWYASAWAEFQLSQILFSHPLRISDMKTCESEATTFIDLYRRYISECDSCADLRRLSGG